jgi:hypothetical protein
MMPGLLLFFFMYMLSPLVMSCATSIIVVKGIDESVKSCIQSFLKVISSFRKLPPNCKYFVHAKSRRCTGSHFRRIGNPPLFAAAIDPIRRKIYPLDGCDGLLIRLT